MMLTLLFAAFMQAATAAQAPPAAPAPAPGSPGTFKAGAELDAAIKKAAGITPDMATAPISITDQYRINIVHRGKAAGAIAHPGNTELHYVIEGAGTIVTGGTIVRAAAAGGPATIQDGVSRHLVKGDVIIVPPNTPHWYKDVEGTITYLEVRFVAPK
jgi:mannose-6-phosphate isomerase-like protein (cupin superfamily)